MGISRDGTFHKDDLLEYARIVEKYVKQTHATEVLELACGRGANSLYLAGRFPKTSFYGLDLPDGQLNYALKRAEKFANVHPAVGDYHDLSMFPAAKFDLVFVIEALCYSTNKAKVLHEIHRVLKKDGICIIADAYTKKPLDKLTTDELLAKRLIERGMLVEDFMYYPTFKKLVQRSFRVLYEEDISEYLLPTLYRFEAQAKFLFSLPKSLGKLIVRLLPSDVVNNAISGYLMPLIVKNGIAQMEIFVLKRKSTT